jgi:phosphoserine phosphatase
VIAFLQEITQGPDALPAADRVAAFDNDGTLACEKPHTALAGFLLDRAAAAAGPAPPEVASGHDVLRELGVLFAGQTTAQYEEQARRYLTGALHPRFQRPYPMLTYQPMLELISLLHALDFSVFMCTDSSRDFMRVIAGPAYGLRRERVIGSEVQIQSVDGRLVRTALPVPMDDGPGRTVHLWDRTGTQPVLAAGNAAGDIDMLRAARFALVIHHDDAVREYAYDDYQILDAAAEGGWTVLSMRDEFAPHLASGPRRWRAVTDGVPGLVLRSFSARGHGQCFAAFLTFLLLCLTLPTSFLVFLLAAFASCFAFLAAPMTDSSSSPETPRSDGCHLPRLMHLKPRGVGR